MKSNQQKGTLTMHKTVPATVTIHFTDGTTQCFEFEAAEIDPLTSASRLEKLLVRKHLQIHLSDRVLVIPMQSIKFMEFTPVPHLAPNLSEFVVGNAQPISLSQAINWNELATHPEYDGRARIQDNASVHERPLASVGK